MYALANILTHRQASAVFCLTSATYGLLVLTASDSNYSKAELVTLSDSNYSNSIKNALHCSQRLVQFVICQVIV